MKPHEKALSELPQSARELAFWIGDQLSEDFDAWAQRPTPDDVGMLTVTVADGGTAHELAMWIGALLDDDWDWREQLGSNESVGSIRALRNSRDYLVQVFIIGRDDYLVQAMEVRDPG